jgi:hypothetical protein
MHSSPFPDTTFTLATKSTGLVHRASQWVTTCDIADSSLFDLPESSVTVLRPDGRMSPSHIPSLVAVQSVQTALELFRKRIPPTFVDPSGPGYDGLADPWWILLHLNLYTAEMLMWKEMAHHRSKGYETAVSCARAIVGLVQRMRADSWIHLGESPQPNWANLRRRRRSGYLSCQPIPLQRVRPARQGRTVPSRGNGGRRSGDAARGPGDGFRKVAANGESARDNRATGEGGVAGEGGGVREGVDTEGHDTE